MISFASDQVVICTSCFVFGLFAGFKLKMPLKVVANIILKEPTKLVLVVRDDLKMDKGKIVAQCCHGTLLSYSKILKTNPSLCQQWEYSGQPKVVVKVKGISEIRNIQNKAYELGIVNEVVNDAGRTQVAAGSITILAVGPDTVSKINKLTGHLKLL